MKKTVRKTTAIILSVLMLFSAFSGISASALTDTGTGGYADYKNSLSSGETKLTELSGAQLASVAFDWVEEKLLADVYPMTRFNIGSDEHPAYISLKSIDDFVASVVDILDSGVLEGDWVNADCEALRGVKRENGDLEMIYAVIQFVADNAALVAKVINFTFDYGRLLASEEDLEEGESITDDANKLLIKVFDVENIVRDLIDDFNRDIKLLMPEDYTLDQWLNRYINFNLEKFEEEYDINLDTPVDITQMTIYDIIKDFVVSLTEWDLLDDSITKFTTLLDEIQVLEYLYYSDYATEIQQQDEIDELNYRYPWEVEILYQTEDWTFFNYNDATYARKEKTENDVTTVSYLDITDTRNYTTDTFVAVDEQTKNLVLESMENDGIQENENGVVYTYGEKEYVVYDGNVYGFFNSVKTPVETTGEYTVNKDKICFGNGIIVKRNGDEIKTVKTELATVYGKNGKIDYVCQPDMDTLKEQGNNNEEYSFSATVINDYSVLLDYINPQSTLTMADFGVEEGYKQYNSIFGQLNHIFYVAINKVLLPEVSEQIGWMDGDNSLLSENIDRSLPVAYEAISRIVEMLYRSSAADIMDEFGLTQAAFNGGARDLLLSVLSAITKVFVEDNGRRYTNYGEIDYNNWGFTIADEFTSIEQIAAVWCEWLSGMTPKMFDDRWNEKTILHSAELYNKLTNTDRTFRLTDRQELREYCMLILSEIAAAIADEITRGKIGVSWKQLKQMKNRTAADVIDELVDSLLYYIDGLFVVCDDMEHQKGVTDGNGGWYKLSKILNELLPTTLINGCDKTYGDERLGFDLGMFIDNIISSVCEADVEGIARLFYRNTGDENELFNTKPLLYAVLGLVQRIVNSVLPGTIEDDMLVSADEFVTNATLTRIVKNLCVSLNNRKTGIIPSALAILNMLDLFKWQLFEYYPDIYNIKAGQTIYINSDRDVYRTYIKLDTQVSRDYKITVTPTNGKTAKIVLAYSNGDDTYDYWYEEYEDVRRNPEYIYYNGSVTVNYDYSSGMSPYFRVYNEDYSDAPIRVSLEAVGNDFSYIRNYNDKGVRLRSYTGTDTQLTVPVTAYYEGTKYNVMYDGMTSETVEKLIIPDDVIIDGEAYYGNARSLLSGLPNLKEVVVSETNPYLKVVDGALYSKDGKILYGVPAKREYDVFTVSSEVEKIAVDAFKNNSSINELVFECPIAKTKGYEESINNLDCLNTNENFRGVTVCENDENFVSVNGILYSKDMSKLYIYPSACTESEYIVPETVHKLETNCFGDNKYLQTLKFMGELDSFGTEIVWSCTALQDVYFYNPQVRYDYSRHTPDYKVHGYPNSPALEYAKDCLTEFIPFENVSLVSADINFDNKVHNVAAGQEYYHFGFENYTANLLYSDGKTANMDLSDRNYKNISDSDMVNEGENRVNVNILDLNFSIPYNVIADGGIIDLEVGEFYYGAFGGNRRVRFTTQQAGYYAFNSYHNFYCYREDNEYDKIYKNNESYLSDYYYVIGWLEANTTYIICSEYDWESNENYSVEYVSSYNTSCEHNSRLTEWVSDRTCTSYERLRCICQSCGMSYEYYCWDEYEAHNIEQSPVIMENVTQGNCKTRGYYETACVCADCGQKVYTGVHIDMSYSVHVPLAAVQENVQPATCKTEGSYDSVVYCDDCGNEISRETVTTQKVSHTPLAAVQENVQPATCKTEGSYDSVVYCGDCGDEISRETVTTQKVNHTPVVVKENVNDAACFTSGSYDKVTYCSDCGDEISREAKTIAPYGHSDYDGDGQCDRCGEGLAERELSFGEKISQFFQKILDWFRNLFTF